MSATNSTPNYDLPLFIATDKPSWQGDFNGAMSKIDTAIKAASESGGGGGGGDSQALIVANEAKTIAQAAQTTANEAKTAATTASSTASSASALAQSASDAVSQTNINVTANTQEITQIKAQLPTMQTTITNATNKANAAQTAADAASAKANTASSTATQAASSASTALSTAQSAQTAAETAQTTANNAQQMAMNVRINMPFVAVSASKDNSINSDLTKGTCILAGNRITLITGGYINPDDTLTRNLAIFTLPINSSYNNVLLGSVNVNIKYVSQGQTHYLQTPAFVYINSVSPNTEIYITLPNSSLSTLPTTGEVDCLIASFNLP